MTSAVLPVTHIRLDEQGRPWIEGTTMKVVELVTVKTAYGWDAEEMARQYPHLTLSQIHSALAYYYDNKAMLDTEVDRLSREAEIERAKNLDSPIRRRLRALGKLP
ncbi:MAG TPA: DUF433 domain-containing protein [Tepidisphaeraceae bacterium]|nr:DUF433 domain-containing protein [Tepidisphaeraceae bacterium]